MGLKAKLNDVFTTKNAVTEQIINEIYKNLNEQWVTDFIAHMAQRDLIRKDQKDIPFYFVISYLKENNTKITYILTDEFTPSNTNDWWSKIGDSHYNAAENTDLIFDVAITTKAILHKLETFEDFKNVEINSPGRTQIGNRQFCSYLIIIKNPLI